MNIWNNIVESFSSIYVPIIRFTDVLEIFIIIFLVYKALKGIKNTRTFVVMKGMALLLGFYLLAQLFSFEVILIIFQSVAIIAIFASIVVFQPEIRKFLERIGTKGISKNITIKSLFVKNKVYEKRYSDKTIKQLVDSVFALGETKTGALIVIEHKIPLNEYIDSGIMLNADISSQLLINIFERNTPLHDGAIIIRGDKIIAGTCYLPLTSNPKVSKKMGTRHRAGIGISEVTDCFVIIVSEETGKVSYAHGDKLRYNITQDELMSKLIELQNTEKYLKVDNKKSIKNNWKIKLASVIIGTLGWLSILNMTNPMTTVVIKDVPIQIVNDKVITNLQKTYEIVSGDYVDVIVKDHRSIIDSLKKEDIIVTADMSKLSYVYSVSLKAKSTKYPSLDIKFLNDKDTVIVKLDDIVSKEFPITIEKQGNVKKGYYVHKLTPNYENIVITGPDKLLKTINKVILPVNVEDITDNNTIVSSPSIYDGNGVLLNNADFTFNIKNFTIKAEMYKSKEVPLNLELETKEENDYNLKITSYTPNFIFIAGEESKLKRIKEINVTVDSSIDLKGSISNQYTKTVNIIDYLPEEIYLAQNDDKIEIQLEAEPYKSKNISFDSKDIKILNLADGYQAQLNDSSYELEVMGISEVLENVKIEDMIPYLDLQDLKEGEYNLVLQFAKIENLKTKSNIAINLTIKKQK